MPLVRSPDGRHGRRVRQVFAQQNTSKSKALTFRFYHDKNNYHFSTEKPEYDIVFHKLDACSCHLMKRIEVKIYCLVMQRFRLVCQLEYPRVTCILSVYIRAFRRVCLSRKDKWQVGYSIVYHQKASHDYFIPCHRKYSGQHKKWEIRADIILNCFELASYCIRRWQRFKSSKVFY